MSRPPLHPRRIAELAPKAEPYDVLEGTIKGLTLRVRPDGVKVWTLRYRAGTKQRRLKLGPSDRLSLAAARKRANEELRKVDAGADPQAARQAAKDAEQRAQGDTIEALAAAYIERHARPRKRTWRADASYLKCEILPVWKGRPASSISRRDCRELLQAIADRGAPIYANRIGAMLSRMFRFGVDADLLTANPASQLPKPGVESAARPEGEQERKAYDPDEVRRIWTNTESMDAAPRAMVRVGLLTGARPGEIAGLRWDELQADWWSLPGRRSKNGREHRVFLVPSALAELARVDRPEGEPHAFPGWRSTRARAELISAAFLGVQRRLKPLHSLRTTAATGLASGGVPVEHIARILNHTYGPRVTMVYNLHSYDLEKRAGLLRWERALDALVRNEAGEPAKVVTMAARA